MSQTTVSDPIVSNIIRPGSRPMSDFLQLHYMTAYSAGLPNRDRDGEPKIITYGNAMRGRISSQCLKRTCRCGRLFNHAFGDLGDDELGLRTKELGGIVYHRLIEGGLSEADAEQWTLALAAVFGPTKPKKKGTMDHLKNETMFLVSPVEKQALLGYADRVIAQKMPAPAIKGKEEFEKFAVKLRPEILSRKDFSIDQALFGRMFASDKSYSIEGSVQVAHAFTVHSVDIQDDFLTAVDDVKDSDENMGEDRGSGHLGEQSLVGAVFYHYVSFNLTMLKANLTDPTLAARGTRTAIESFLTEFPRAKGNSCAQQSRAIYGRLEFGQKMPRNLGMAFLDPIDGKDIGRRAIERLRETSANIDKVYGPCCDKTIEFDTMKGEGSIAKLLDMGEQAVGGGVA